MMLTFFKAEDTRTVLRSFLSSGETAWEERFQRFIVTARDELEKIVNLLLSEAA